MHGADFSLAHINLARGFRGGERQTQLLIEELSAHSVRQVLVARRGNLLAARCAGIDGLEIRAVASNVLTGARALGGVDVVHVHEGRAAQSAWLNASLRRIPYVITRRIQKGPHATRLNRIIYRRAACVVAISTAIVRSLEKVAPDRDVRVIADATSQLVAVPDKVAGLRQAFGGRFVIGHIGALDDSAKGQLQIIALARRLGAEIPDLVFVLVGSGRDEEKLKSAAADLENVRFTGYVDDVGNYLAAFDAFIYPSRHEGLGSILLDAFEFGLPVIATDVGGIPEVVKPGVNGFLCAVNDLDAQVQAVRNLYEDAGLRERFARSNRQAAKNFLPARMAEQYTQVYAQVIDHSGQQQASI